VNASRVSEESEIKVPVPDLAPVRDRLAANSAVRVSELHDEMNVLFDDDAGRLASGGCVLRVRTARGRTILTFKGPPAFDGPVKRREEIEVEIGDRDAAERILDRLGFRPRFRYAKRREEFRCVGGLVALDETPIGRFVEIEGDSAAIAVCAAVLGLRHADAERRSYAGLYRRAREKDPSLPPDMLFGS
jgi:adenylate cyclase class 2